MRSDRLLVWLKPRYIGDTIMATPLLRALAQEFRSPHVLAAPHLEVLLKEDSRGLDFGRASDVRGLKDVFAEARRLRGMGFQSALIVNRSFRSALTAWLARIPNRFGHATEGRGMLLTHKVAYDEERHESECYNDLGRLLGLTTFAPIHLTLTSEEREEGLRLKEDADVLVQPGATHDLKRIQVPVLIPVVRELQAQGRRIVFLGGKEEERFGHEVQDGLKQPVLNLIGKTSLRQSLAIACHLKAALGGTTGMMHMAASVGCPTVQVFGPDNPKKWGHPPPHQNVLVPSRSILDAEPEPIIEALARALSA